MCTVSGSDNQRTYVCFDYEIDCKYKVDGCEISGGPHNIIQHEEACQLRLV